MKTCAHASKHSCLQLSAYSKRLHLSGCKPTGNALTYFTLEFMRSLIPSHVHALVFIVGAYDIKNNRYPEKMLQNVPLEKRYKTCRFGFGGLIRCRWVVGVQVWVSRAQILWGTQMWFRFGRVGPG